MSQIQAALFILAGGGDYNIFLAPKAAIDWCNTIMEGNHAIPEELKLELAPFLDQNANLDEEIDISWGSSDNDAALHLSGLCKNYDTVIEAVKVAIANGWTLDNEEEYRGTIY